jgi:hypothetical protein
MKMVKDPQILRTIQAHDLNLMRIIEQTIPLGFVLREFLKWNRELSTTSRNVVPLRDCEELKVLLVFALGSGHKV